MQAAPASLLPACHQRWVQASTSSLLTSIGLKNEIARDDHANRKPRSDSQRGRNVELSAPALLARIVDRVLPAFPNFADTPIGVFFCPLGSAPLPSEERRG